MTFNANDVKINGKIKLDADEVKFCFRLLRELRLHYRKGYILARELNTDPQTIRKYVMWIRREMVTGFQNPTGCFYIIANKYGYKLSKERNQLNPYLKKLQTRQKNLKLQINQLKLCIKNINFVEKDRKRQKKEYYLKEDTFRR